MEYIQENERTPKKDEGGINLRDVVELIIANWYWFVLSVLVCVGSAYFYVLTIQPVYQRQAVMLVKDKEKSASDMSAMLEVSGGITGTSVDNEIYILRSHQLLREVVNRLHLDVGYAKDGILRDAPLYAESPVEVHFYRPLQSASVIQYYSPQHDKVPYIRLESGGRKGPNAGAGPNVQ